MSVNNSGLGSQSAAESNAVAATFKTIAVITWALGGIAAIIVAITLESVIWFLAMALSSFLSGMMTYAFGEIIQRLHNIDHNTRSNSKIIVAEKAAEQPDEIPEL